jgi:enoyl-CoA hydratase/carnithine racemase
VGVPRLIEAHRIADMMLIGRVLDAQEGHGVSHYLVGEGEGLAKALELATKIVTNSTVTNLVVLQALPRIAEANPAEGRRRRCARRHLLPSASSARTCPPRPPTPPASSAPPP